MGLTLNSNSLTLGSAGGGGSSGLTEAQVKTLIKNNTPYQHIGTLEADNTAVSLDFDDIPAYTTYKVIFDGLMPSTSSTYCEMRFYKTVGTPHTASDYYYGSYYGGSNGGSGFSVNSATSFNLNESAHFQYGITGDMEISSVASQPATVRWTIAMGTGVTALRFDGSGFWNDVAQPVGFQFTTTSGNWSQGKVHLYGVNR